MAHALSLAAGRPRPAGTIALSGFIPTVPGFELDFGKAAGLPVAIGHGTLDPVIDAGFGRNARDRLEEAGADVLFRESQMAHTVDPGFIAELAGWVPRVVGPEDASG
jgi:phospholipase/carboxylesterase